MAITASFVGDIANFRVLKIAKAILMPDDAKYAGVWIEADAGGVFTRGADAYQAASGKCSHTGTVRLGVMVSVPRAASPPLWEIALD